jgi:hypothetical protein
MTFCDDLVENGLGGELTLSEDTIVAFDPNIPPDQGDDGSPKLGPCFVDDVIGRAKPFEQGGIRRRSKAQWQRRRPKNSGPNILRKGAAHEEMRGSFWAGTTELTKGVMRASTPSQDVSREALPLHREPGEELALWWNISLPYDWRKSRPDGANRLHSVS